MFGFNIDLKNRECIVISSDSDSENESRSCSIKRKCSEIQNQLKLEMKSESIDAVLDQVTSDLKRQKKQLKARPKQYQYMKNCVSSDDDTDNSKFSSIIRNAKKCELGLRREVVQTKRFDPLEKQTKECVNDDEINYLLVKNSRKKMKCSVQLEDSSSSAKSSDADEQTQLDNIGQQISLFQQSWSQHARLLKRSRIFSQVSGGKLCLEDVCLTCGSDEVVCPHPLFIGSLCMEHKDTFKNWFFHYDQDGCSSYCSVCCFGNKVAICDQPDCGKCYCFDCLNLLIEPGYSEVVSSVDDWKCFLCIDNNNKKHLIVRRPDWQHRLQLFFSEPDHQYASAPIPKPIPPEERRPIRVLSLFDGIATGLLAIQQLGLEVGKFIASEIDESAIRLVQNRHLDVVLHVGDITTLTDDDVINYGPFDLVMGGSPCNDLSGANPRRKGLSDVEGTGCLFFDFYRVLKAAKPKCPHPDCKCGENQRPFFWLFENVLSMKIVERRLISRFLGCDPVLLDARSVSAATRPRLFWGNLPNMRRLELVPGRQDRLDVQSCLEPGRVATVEKLNTITTRPGCLYQGSVRRAPVTHHGKEDVLWSTELERIFGIPEHYTDVNNLGPRERLALLGRSWSVPVVRQLLAPLKEYFSSRKPALDADP